MASQTIVVLIDDLDGSELSAGTRTTTFSLNGTHYAIDLSDENAAKLSGALAPFVSQARKVVSERATSRKSGKNPASTERLARIRSWAASNGTALPKRGRIPGSIIERYESETNDVL